jgi:tryptophan-rich sensory protein
MWSKVPSLIAAVSIPLLGGAMSGFATRSSTRGKWFRNLRKPSWNPPRAVFPVVWTILYIMMGVASWLVWKDGGNRGDDCSRIRRRNALILYAAQLAVNIAWTFVFFLGRNIRGGLYVVLTLCVALLATIACFWTISRAAALLLVPYAAWVAFATALNWSIVTLN